MNAQILIKCGQNCFAFSKSRTGQLDYEGKITVSEKLEGYQLLSSSTYFSPSFYAYLAESVNNSPKVFVAPDVDISDADTFDFLLHIGAVLSAVEAKDSLLAGELYLRRRGVFEKFAPLTQYILESLCVEILFSLSYGRMQNVEPEEIPLIFNSAKKKLNFQSERETLNQAFMRYFKENSVTLTLPLVGTNFYSWEAMPDSLEHLTDNLSADDLLTQAEKIRRAKHDFYASLEVAVQAEPYNPHDKNAILVCIESLEAKLSGNPGLEKAGHIRALAAKVIREAKEQKLSYESKLQSVSYRDIVVQVTL